MQRPRVSSSDYGGLIEAAFAGVFVSRYALRSSSDMRHSFHMEAVLTEQGDEGSPGSRALEVAGLREPGSYLIALCITRPLGRRTYSM